MSLSYPTKKFTDGQVAQAEDFFDVSKIPNTETGLPGGEYTATITVTPVNSNLNTSTSAKKTLVYDVETLPNADLKVTDDGSKLYWAPIQMTDGKAVDEIDEFEFYIKKSETAAWEPENVTKNLIHKAEDGSFYVELSDLLEKGYTIFRVVANNTEDATFTSSSDTSVTVYKLQAVTAVTLVDTVSGEISVTWTDANNTDGLLNYKVELLKDGEVVESATATTTEKAYTFKAADIDPEAKNTYTVRVTAMGTKTYPVFYADSAAAVSGNSLVSGSVPTVDKTGTIYEQSGKLYLKVDLLDVNDSYSKIDTVILSRLTGNGMIYTTAVTGELHPAAGEANAYVVFDLSDMNVTSLQGGTWKATLKVNSKNEALNASTSGTVTIVYNVEALETPVLTVDPETGAISWNAVPGATKYQITVSYDNANPWTTSMTAASGDGETITYNIDDQTFSADGGMKPGRVYTVEVVAQNDTAMTTPDSQPGTIQVCKIEAPTGVNLNITKTAALAKWTKSATTVNAVAAYEVTAVNTNGTPTYTKTTTTGKVAQQNLAAANNAAENGIYTLQVQALAVDDAVSGVYYVNSDVVTLEETAVKGQLPASDITNVALTWVEDNQLQLSFQLPQITDGMSDYEKAVIEAIDKSDITVTTYNGNTAFGVYSGDAIAVDENGLCTINVTTGTTEGVGEGMPFANVGEKAKVMIKLTSDYKLIYAANMARTAVTIPEQGVISFDGFVVDYEKATLTFPANPNATYTAKLTLGGTTTDLTVADAQDGAKVVDFSAIEAGKDYTLTIEGTDPSNVYQPGTLELHLYKLQTPKSGNINSKTGMLSVTADAAADIAQYAYTLSVSGKYDASSETKGDNGKRTGGIVSFNLKKPAANVDTVITLIGGACTVGEETIHVINSDAYTVTKFVGQLPEVALTSSAIAYNTDKSNSVTFSIDASLDSFAAKEKVIDWSSVTVSAVGSDQGTAVADSVSYDADSHTITATFGEGKLRPTVGYTFTVSLKVAANQVAFAGDRDYTTTEPISYSIDALTLAPTVASNGIVTWNLNAADAVEKITVKVDKSASYDVTDAAKSTNLFTLAKIANDNTAKHTFEIQALAKEGSGYSDSAVVTIYAQRLNSVQVTLTSDGTFTVNTNKNPRDSYSYTVTLTGSEEGSDTYRSNPTGSFISVSTYKWAEGPFQTIKAVTTTSAASSGVAVNGVFYLNAYEKFTAPATDFYVGQLPAVTLTPAEGALNLDADGNLTLAYALAAGVDPALYSELNLSMVQEGYDGTITIEPITAVAANGTFNLDAVKALQGTFNTTLTAKAANPVINSDPAPVETSYSYNTSALATPAVEVDYAKGTLTWAAVEGAASYEVSYGDNPTVVYSGTGTTYQPTAEQIVAGGAAATFKVTAISDKEQVLNSTPAVVTLYRLKTPAIKSFNAQTGVLSITTDSVADKADYAYTVDVTKSSNATETKTIEGAGYVNKTYTFNLTRDAYQASFTVKLTGGYDAESHVHVLNAATYATTKVYAGKLPALTLDTTSFTEAADGTLSVTFAIPETVDNFKYGTQIADVIDFAKSTITAKAGVSSVDGKFETAADGKVTATFDGDFIVRDVEYQFEITLVPSNTYKAVAGENTFTTTGTASIAGTTYAKPDVTMKPDGTFTASDLPEGTKLQVSLDGVTYYDIPVDGNVFDVLGDQMTEAKEYTLYFRVAAESEASDISLFAAEERDPSAPITITVVRLAAPVISIDEEAKTFTVTADATNGKLVVKLDGEDVTLDNGTYDYSTEILSGSFTVTAYVDANEGADPIYLDSTVATAEGTVSGTKLTAPKLTVNVTKGTIVWTADENAKGYSVMVGDVEAAEGEVVYDEGTDKYTYTPDLDAGDYLITIQALGGDNTGYADSDVTTAYVTKMPDVTSVEVHMVDDPDTDGFQSEVYINHDTEIENAYANAGITVNPSNKTVATWDKSARIMTYTNNGDPVTLYVNASVGGATVNDETYGKHYFFRPDVYSMKSDKFTVGAMPDFELVSVVSEGDQYDGSTTVTFEPATGENVNGILDETATLATFVYSYKNGGSYTEYNGGVDAYTLTVTDEGNLVFTINSYTDVAHDLKYTFTATPVYTYSATRGETSVDEEFYYAGNQLATPENLRVEMINGKATLVWDEVEGATSYSVTKATSGPETEYDTEHTIQIMEAGKEVVYKVVATADGCADSEAATLTVYKVDDSQATLGFNATTPVNYNTARVNYTLTGDGVSATVTTSRLKTLLQFTTDSENVTVSQNGAIYTADFAEGYLDGQQTFELTAYLCGQYKDVWYFSNTAATTEVTVGKIATGASIDTVNVTGRAQNVQVKIADVLRTCIDTANIQVSVYDASDNNVATTNTSYSVNASGILTLKFAAGTLVAGETYTVYIDLPSRYACGTGASLECTLPTQ